ncbi:MAG: hypothetical protein IT423_05645 [Pirellulaceae bacterium]|jgi:hypothetical protein|nr:hypothetical protein [Pirellulaceae bacterium]
MAHDISATIPRGWLMPKALCLTGLVIAILVFLIFLSDLLFGMLGMASLAPFKMSNMVMDIIFLLCAAGLGFVSWTSFRELK